MVRALALMVIFQAAVITAGAQTDSTVAANSTVVTQTAARYGYLSYQEALKSMPQYAMVQKKMENLRSQYQAETLRVEEEFNRKYEEFLEGQREFPKTILQKRQTELRAVTEYVPGRVAHAAHAVQNTFQGHVPASSRLL